MSEKLDRQAARELFSVEYENGSMLDASGDGGFTIFETRAEAKDAMESAQWPPDVDLGLKVVRFVRAELEAETLIASQAAEITKLELCLEPGKASAIVRAVFDIAEKKCGHNPFSARHGLTTIDEYLDRQAALIQSMREALEASKAKSEIRHELAQSLALSADERDVEIERLREAIAGQPHTYLCAASTKGNPVKIGPCNCWKSRALAQVSASQVQPEEKTNE